MLDLRRAKLSPSRIYRASANLYPRTPLIRVKLPRMEYDDPTCRRRAPRIILAACESRDGYAPLDGDTFDAR